MHGARLCGAQFLQDHYEPVNPHGILLRNVGAPEFEALGLVCLVWIRNGVKKIKKFTHFEFGTYPTARPK